MAHKLIWGADLYKGFKLDKNTVMGSAIDDILPFQMLTLEEKSEHWIKAVADYYEVAGWGNVERKAHKIQRNFWMRQGKLNPNDYIVNPEHNPYSHLVTMLVPPESQSPLEQFYPLAPSFVDMLRGEFIKRDNRWTVEAIDPTSKAEAFAQKEEGFKQVITQQAMLEKHRALAEMGVAPETDPEQYEVQMQQAMNQLREVELKSKNFRTTGQKWAEKVLKIHEKRYKLSEIEPDGFESGLITDSEFWHIDLLDDDFKVELLNPKWCDYHKGPNIKYVSEGDYFLWFDFMSAGDIVNKFGRKMHEDDILKLKDIYVKTANLMVPDYLKARQGEYYDLSKPWSQATDLNPVMNDVLLGKELAYSYMRSPNFDHNIDVDILNPVWGRIVTGHPQMFRVMRLYWRSLKRIGWLTKINRDGSRVQPDWIDENYKVTVEPEYDKSVVKEETKDNLLYGEHIDWTWVPEWRHVIKISPNQKHTFWLNSHNTLESIYIDGGPVKFQFKGQNNPFDSLPPVEGCIFSWINTTSHSFIDRICGLQIIYNIAMNKVPRKFLEDKGIKVAVDRRSFPRNNMYNTTTGVDPREEYEDRLNNSQILEYSIDRESAEGMGQPALPTVLNLSTGQEAMFYLQVADQIKWMAAENVGITRARLGGQKASESATGVQQGINFSETQTEKYYEQHSNLMQRFRQRMLDAAQYYTTFKESAREIYMNDRDENIFVDIEGMDNLLPHYNINLESKANTRAVLKTITEFLINENTLPIKPSAKVESIIENSVPRILNLIRTSELEQEQMQIAQQEAELAQKRQQLEATMQMEAENRAHEDYQKQLDRDNAVEIATIRALGGIQTDNNKDGQTDAMENLEPYFKQQEINDKRKATQDALNQKRQIDTDKMLLEREKAEKELEKEKIKGEYALKVAKENKTNRELGKK